MRKILYRPRAQTDLDSIFVYIAVDLGSPGAAKKLRKKLSEAIERIADVPTVGKAFVDEELGQAYRRILVENYWVYYTFDSKKIVIWRIVHASRDVDHYGFHVFE